MSIVRLTANIVPMRFPLGAGALGAARRTSDGGRGATSRGSVDYTECKFSGRGAVKDLVETATRQVDNMVSDEPWQQGDPWDPWDPAAARGRRLKLDSGNVCRASNRKILPRVVLR